MNWCFFLFVIFLNPIINLGQCPFTPSINKAELIICPNVGHDTLWTQNYDSYQWFKNNSPIAGATNQFFIVSDSDIVDSGYCRLFVIVVFNGCTDTSTTTIVKAFGHFSPTVVIDGIYKIDTSGELLACVGDTLTFTVYSMDTNLVWYKEGNQYHIGDTSLLVNESGSYTVTGADKRCPNYPLSLGQEIKVLFDSCINNIYRNDYDELVTFPNPCIDKLLINTPVQIESVLIHNVQGVEQYPSIIFDSLSTNNKIVVDMSRLSKGIYVLKIRTSKGEVIKRVIKE